MNRFNLTRFAMAAVVASTALVATVPAQAQPMMGDMAMHHNEDRMHERMTQRWEKRQTELKAKLHLSAEQEPAWTAFVQGMKMPNKPLMQPVDREALTKLSTPERLEKMNAVHEANLATIQTHRKQRAEATRTFYSQLSAEQQKVFDAETLPEHSRWKGKGN